MFSRNVPSSVHFDTTFTFWASLFADQSDEHYLGLHYLGDDNDDGHLCLLIILMMNIILDNIILKMTMMMGISVDDQFDKHFLG